MKNHHAPPSSRLTSASSVVLLSGAFAAWALTGCSPQSNAQQAAAPVPATQVATSYQAQPQSGGTYASPPPGAQAYAPPVQQGAQPVPQAPVPYPGTQTAYAPAPQYAQAPVYASPPAPVPSYAPPVQQAAPRVVQVREAPQIASNHIGRISHIEAIRERPSGSGAGGVLGGVLGAVVGNQFGHGNGRTAMTVLGAAGGAVAGNNVERNIHERVVGYRVSVRLDDGEVRSYQQSNLGDLQIGDRVRVDGQHLHRV